MKRVFIEEGGGVGKGDRGEKARREEISLYGRGFKGGYKKKKRRSLWEFPVRKVYSIEDFLIDTLRGGEGRLTV